MANEMENLRDLISYEPEAGKMFWKERPQARPEWNARFAGKEAFASPHSKGYLCGTLKVDGVKRVFLAHRVAWALHFGEMPRGIIDHINGDKTDNRISNLRAATFFQNSRNMTGRKVSSSTGEWGIYRQEGLSGFAVRLAGIHLGVFEEIRDAKIARGAAARVLNFSENHMNMEQNHEAV